MSGLAGARLTRRDNGLNLVRLGLAVTVLISHSVVIGGFGPEPSPGGVTVGQWAVGGFFAISGYLVARSRERSSLPTFLRRRTARIYPAYWVSLVVVALVFAPAAALMSGRGLDAGAAAEFVVRNATLLIRQWTVGATLDTAPGTHMWNGSLWTLSYEFGAYLLVAVVVVSPVYRRWPLLTALLLHVLCALPASQFPPEWAAPWLGGFFTAGLVWHAMGDRFRVTWSCALFMVAVLAILTLTEEVRGFAGIPLAYLVLSAGAALPANPATHTDVSYGTYLYAYPVSQVLALIGMPRFGVPLYVVAIVVGTAALALPSWYLVERPAQLWAERAARSWAGRSATGSLAPRYRAGEGRSRSWDGSATWRSVPGPPAASTRPEV